MLGFDNVCVCVCVCVGYMLSPREAASSTTSATHDTSKIGRTSLNGRAAQAQSAHTQGAAAAARRPASSPTRLIRTPSGSSRRPLLQRTGSGRQGSQQPTDQPVQHTASGTAAQQSHAEPGLAASTQHGHVSNAQAAHVSQHASAPSPVPYQTHVITPTPRTITHEYACESEYHAGMQHAGVGVGAEGGVVLRRSLSQPVRTEVAPARPDSARRLAHALSHGARVVGGARAADVQAMQMVAARMAQLGSAAAMAYPAHTHGPLTHCMPEREPFRPPPGSTGRWSSSGLIKAAAVAAGGTAPQSAAGAQASQVAQAPPRLSGARTKSLNESLSALCGTQGGRAAGAGRGGPVAAGSLWDHGLQSGAGPLGAVVPCLVRPPSGRRRMNALAGPYVVV